MTESITWGYAINQWNVRLNVFVRREAHERAFKTLSALGFRTIELAAGSGRWDNLGRPELIELGHGSIEGFMRFLNSCGIDRVASMFWDPGRPGEEEGWAFLGTQRRDDHDAILAAATPFLDFLPQVGADRLVVRPVGSAWMTGPLDGEAFAAVGDLWNRVGERSLESGVRTVLHLDCLSAIHSLDDISALLAATDPALVGLAVDTAELTIAGIDPVEFYRAHHDRVRHVHLKNTLFTDSGAQYLQPGAETAMLNGGDDRGIERWFYELGVEGGLVDVPAFMAALDQFDYSGAVIVESDHGSNPADLAMLNSWYVQRRLGVDLRSTVPPR
ncbi:sugar phosphate isomerase/epimerase family protein [Subtercola sp. YIM 133946]|uniref:sugar phosphate isomerase/epimerase family protein n=1 Tax=Subtercola sp. YIM 133946 TaxID=3118909 RepID=UPI002F932EC2